MQYITDMKTNIFLLLKNRLFILDYILIYFCPVMLLQVFMKHELLQN